MFMGDHRRAIIGDGLGSQQDITMRMSQQLQPRHSSSREPSCILWSETTLLAPQQSTTCQPQQQHGTRIDWLSTFSSEKAAAAGSNHGTHHAAGV